jgi:integrase/recombinase XerD
VSAFAQHAGEYLRLRRALGHELADAARLLPRFVAFLDATGASAITIEAALAWAQRPDAGPGSSVWARRMTVARGFARYMSGIDPVTEVPPLGLVTFRKHWRPPFIYSEADVKILIAAVPQLVPTPFRAATFQTMIGLLAATGMRVGEVIALGCGDIDWAEGVLVVRNSKFGKSREVPLHPTTVQALASYARFRDRHVPRPASPAFFSSAKGTPVIYADFGAAFRKLVVLSGVGADSPVSPRIHDLRHYADGWVMRPAVTFALAAAAEPVLPSA